MTTRPFFAPMLASFAATALVLAPGAARAADAIELVRAGDGAMSCTALAAEINALAQPVAAAEKPKKKKGFGFLKVLGSVAPFVPGIGVGAMLAGSAIGSAANVAAEDGAKEAMEDAQRMTRDAMAGPSVAAQRRDRLTAIFESKGC